MAIAALRVGVWYARGQIAWSDHKFLVARTRTAAKLRWPPWWGMARWAAGLALVLWLAALATR